MHKLAMGRLDGDEVVVLADAIDTMEADCIVEEFLAEIAHPLKLGEVEYRISVSVGIAMFSGHGHNAEELIRNPQMVTSWCKRHSRGGSEFYPDGASTAADRLATIELKLPIALEQRVLAVHYRPTITSATVRSPDSKRLSAGTVENWGKLLPQNSFRSQRIWDLSAVWVK